VRLVIKLIPTLAKIAIVEYKDQSHTICELKERKNKREGTNNE